MHYRSLLSFCKVLGHAWHIMAYSPAQRHVLDFQCFVGFSAGIDCSVSRVDIHCWVFVGRSTTFATGVDLAVSRLDFQFVVNVVQA